jgi:hypothetical protein
MIRRCDAAMVDMNRQQHHHVFETDRAKLNDVAAGLLSHAAHEL